MINKINFTGNYAYKSQDNKKNIAKAVAFSSICLGAGVLALKLARGKKISVPKDVFESGEGIKNVLGKKAATVVGDSKNSVGEQVATTAKKAKDTFKDKVNSALNEGKRLFVTSDLKVHDITDKSLDLSKICDNGILMAKNKSGLVEIRYEDGDIVKSFINGKLLKTYNSMDVAEADFNSKNFKTGSYKVKEILKLTRNGKKQKQTFLAYANDGSLKRTLVYDFSKDSCNAIDFSKNGKPYVFSNYYCTNQPWLVEQKIYDANGEKLLKEIKHTRDGYQVQDFKKKKINIGHCSHSFVSDYSLDSKVDVVFFKEPNFMGKAIDKFAYWLRNK